MRQSRHYRLHHVVALTFILIGSTALCAQEPSPTSSPQVQPPSTASQGATQNAEKPAVHFLPATPERMADSLMARKRYQAAIDAYTKAPPTAAVWNKMGIAHQMMFNLDEAIKCYKASLKLDGKNASVLNNLGTVYDSQKNYKQAEKMYRKALKVDPHSALVLKNLGTELLARHKYEKGWEAYKAALATDPTIFSNNGTPRVENPGTIRERGAMNYYMAKGCLRAGFPDRAIEYLRHALNEGFTNPKMIRGDREFATLLGNPEFERMLAAQKNP